MTHLTPTSKRRPVAPRRPALAKASCPDCTQHMIYDKGMDQDSAVNKCALKGSC